ncbi:hypothetical protein LAZ67_16001064 [Cordylochernes scorpioides]|uniref:Carboxylic ester hydrolase n=1 Tax=Cordylochernes scorpioides TaxID=51811 RepID=A0ABY6LB35_9ARAC|nr:hypothetical protein LAZ67_16001064 [Cordylochernes scorpioides]
MKRSLEQRYAIKFCVRLGKNATETFQMLQKAFKDECISRSQSGKWHKAFKEGREEVADEPRSGRPTTARTDENVDRVLKVLRTDRRSSIQQIADTLHMSTFVVHGIVTEDLQMRKVCAKLVPKVLTQDQKELRVLRCQELLDLIKNEPGFLNSVVTGDESWMFEYDPESKRQSCAWHTKSSPRPKKARMSKSRIKTMIIVFFDIRGIVHCEFVPQGKTVNSAFYLEVLRRLKRWIARVRTDIKDTVKLHHDNATSHTAFIITNFLARSNTPVIPHPPYSLDLAPCDFFLFPRLKREMKGTHWETVENIQHHVTTFLRSIPVETDMVIVTVNYRVGSLGFLDLNMEGAYGNLGLKDQILAFKWVNKNIRAFGGDPDNVTLYGFSAGSVSIAFHLPIPKNKGLFKRAILQSGTSNSFREFSIISMKKGISTKRFEPAKGKERERERERERENMVLRAIN